MTCGAIPRSAIRVAHVRRRSCSVHGSGKFTFAFSRALLSDQALKPPAWCVPNSWSRSSRCGTAQIRSSAPAGISGKVCARPFLLRSFGIVQVPAFEIGLAPGHAAHLAATRARQDQQAHDLGKVVAVIGRLPDRSKLAVVEHALARFSFQPVAYQ